MWPRYQGLYQDTSNVGVDVHVRSLLELLYQLMIPTMSTPLASCPLLLFASSIQWWMGCQDKCYLWWDMHGKACWKSWKSYGVQSWLNGRPHTLHAKICRFHFQHFKKWLLLENPCSVDISESYLDCLTINPLPALPLRYLNFPFSPTVLDKCIPSWSKIDTLCYQVENNKCAISATTIHRW